MVEFEGICGNFPFNCLPLDESMIADQMCCLKRIFEYASKSRFLHGLYAFIGSYCPTRN